MASESTIAIVLLFVAFFPVGDLWEKMWGQDASRERVSEMDRPLYLAGACAAMCGIAIVNGWQWSAIVGAFFAGGNLGLWAGRRAAHMEGIG